MLGDSVHIIAVDGGFVFKSVRVKIKYLVVLLLWDNNTFDLNMERTLFVLVTAPDFGVCQPGT